MDSMVDIRQLTKRFGPITAVDDISFVVRRGEVLGFLGPNGAGKSTTMKIITGFLNPDAGTIVVGGHNIAHHPIRTKQRIGYLPEGAPLYGEMTVRAFLGFVAEVRGFRGAKRAECIDQVAEKVNIRSVLEQPIETLSKGFKRRVGLGQAILHDPDILVLDEPTDGLDPNQKHEVRDLIRGMAENKAIISLHPHSRGGRRGLHPRYHHCRGPHRQRWFALGAGGPARRCTTRSPSRSAGGLRTAMAARWTAPRKTSTRRFNP